MFHTFYVQIPRPARHDTYNLPILSVSRLRNRVFGPATLRDTYEAAHLSVSRQAGMILCPRQQRGAPVSARKMTAGDTATGRGEHLLPKKGLQQKTIERITIESVYGHLRAFHGQETGVATSLMATNCVRTAFYTSYGHPCSGNCRHLLNPILKTGGLMNYTKEQISEIISKHAEQRIGCSPSEGVFCGHAVGRCSACFVATGL